MAPAGTGSSIWWGPGRGDIDTTIAQVGFNLAQLVIPVFLLLPTGVSVAFSVTRLLHWLCVGVSDWIAWSGCGWPSFWLGAKGRSNVTAHVYGNNVPAIIAYTLSIFLPVYLQTRDAVAAWEIGAAAVAWTGIIRTCGSAFRREYPPVHPRAGITDGLRGRDVQLISRWCCCSGCSTNRLWDSLGSPSS